MAGKLTDKNSSKDPQDLFQIDPGYPELNGKSAKYGVDYRFLADHMADIIWTMDLNLKTRYVSPSIEKIIGFTSQERKQQSLEEILTPDSIQSTLQLFSEEIQLEADGTADPQRSVSLEVEYYKKGGSTVWMENHMKAIRDAEGKMIGILGVSRDISKRKHNENQLIASKKEWENIFHAIGHPTMIIDADHKILDINKSTMRLTGLDADQLKGKYCYEIFHQSNTPPEQCPLESLHKNGSLETIEMEMTAVGGTFLVSCTPVTDTDDHVLKYIHIATDITEKKKLETKLRQSKKTEALGTLAGGIAHEFNNILGIIIGNTELAMDDVPEVNPARNFLEEIRNASLRAKEVVRQILSFSLKTPATRKPIKIAPTIEETLKLIRLTTPAVIEIRQEILINSERILSNSDDIKQLLMNLCSNAIHAMTEHTGLLVVRLEPVFLDYQLARLYEGITAGAYVKLTVQDSGKGIAPEIMDRICDPYFTTKDVDQGLGMGLAIVFGIVKKHDGSIKFQSHPGKGTTVEVLLPIASSHPETDVQAPANLPTGTERILVIDDEISLVKMLKITLERYGYDVVGMTSSIAALKLIKEESGNFDLIITDMAMPEMPGDRLAEKIFKFHPQIPLILCTGYSDRIDEEKAKKLNISAFVMKPFMKKDLVNTVREVLDQG